MELGLILTLCGLGVAFWIPAVIIGLISQRKKRRCTADGTATVVRINTRNSENGLEFHPVYEYFVAGKYYTGEGAYISKHVPAVRTVIPVKYDPDDPKYSYIPGYDNKVYKILTIVFGMIGAIPICVCVSIALFLH